ncbi:hypothetical protein [Rubritalea profundi]|nr:hypothetical protein [Rubritalea profundi]
MIASFVFCISLVGAEKPASNLNKPIVKKSDPTVVTHKLRIGKITVGFSDTGGGYLNYLDLGDGKNIVSPRYGRGWQGSLRDQLHSGRYNPTQAGFHDHAGAPVTLVLSKKRLVIPKFNLPLYGDPVFDFTQHEDLVYDHKGYKDNGKTDTDGLDESKLTQDDELRSEFDFEGVYENATALGGGKIPILRFYCRYTYARNPKVILQFGKKAKKVDGKPIIDERSRVPDISAGLRGKQAATDVDLSNIIFTAYGIRLFTKTGYTTPMWYEDGKWKSVTRESVKGRGKEKQFDLTAPAAKKTKKGKKAKNSKTPSVLKSQFLLWAKGKNPKTSPAIALYYPVRSRYNSKSILGVDRKTGREVYREDRSIRNFIFFSHVIPDQIGIRTRFMLSGMLAPKHGKPNVLEALEHETFILFGTPNEILAAVRALDKTLTNHR